MQDPGIRATPGSPVQARIWGNSVYPVQGPERELGGGISAGSSAREPDPGNVPGRHLYAKTSMLQ
jgi:hypothetical protein